MKQSRSFWFFDAIMEMKPINMQSDVENRRIVPKINKDKRFLKMINKLYNILCKNIQKQTF